MKQITTRQLMTMGAKERSELVKEKFELGTKTAGRNSQFIAQMICTPINQVKGK